jgi:putative ABC transport system substrate-binding protein
MHAVLAASAVCHGTARAQQPTGVRRVGLLAFGTGLLGPSMTENNQISAVLRESFRRLGYEAGKNVEFVVRSAQGRTDRLPGVAAELARLRVDVIMTTGSEATRAAQQATTSIPIVFMGPSYPVEEGLVASFGRPGGNITGVTLAQSDHVSKHLQLLRDLKPDLHEVSVLSSGVNAGNVLTVKDMQRAAEILGIEVHSYTIYS